MKIFFVLFSFFFSASLAWAQQSSTELPSRGSQFTAELASGLNLDAGQTLTLLGPAIAYQLDDMDSVGLRALMPISGGKGTIGQIFWRHHFVAVARGLFAELITSFGLRNKYSSLGLGGNLGWAFRLNEGWSLFAAAGASWNFIESFGGGELVPSTMVGAHLHF